MKFININNKNKIFREVVLNDDILYIQGSINYSDIAIISKLKSGKVPNDLKGSFALVFISPKHWIGVVDHLCTTQLFYSAHHISPSLKDVKDNTKFLHEDPLCENQLKILKEHTVGDVTPWKEIKRIDFQHYAINGTQHQYANILNNPISKYDSDDAYDLYTSKIKEICNQDTAVMLSGGKDSAFIVMLLKEIGINPRLIHLTSKNINHSIDDRAIAKYKKLGWDIENHYVDYIGPNNEEEEELFSSNFWSDDTHPPKRRIVLDHKGPVITGEVSIADIQRKTYGSYFANAYDKIKTTDVINRYLIQKMTWTSRKAPFSMAPAALGDLYKSETYEYILNHYLNIINELDQPIVYSHYSVFSHQAEAVRLYAQSQDPGVNWVSLFGDYDIYNMNLNMDWKYKDDMVNNVQKLPLYNVGVKLKAWTDISWGMPIVGLGIPDKKKFNNV